MRSSKAFQYEHGMCYILGFKSSAAEDIIFLNFSQFLWANFFTICKFIHSALFPKFQHSFMVRTLFSDFIPLVVAFGFLKLHFVWAVRPSKVVMLVAGHETYWIDFLHVDSLSRESSGPPSLLLRILSGPSWNLVASSLLLNQTLHFILIYHVSVVYFCIIIVYYRTRTSCRLCSYFTFEAGIQSL